MLANIINAAAVLLGTLIGLVFRKSIRKREDLTSIIYSAVGMITLVLGIMMALRTQRILYFALAIVLGAICGQLLRIERGIEKIGSFLHRSLLPRTAQVEGNEGGDQPARAFLDATVLFCVGSMTILGALQAGIEGNYSILLTKSVMDGVIAILFTVTLGWGVGLSAISIIIYQGGLTVMSSLIEPFVSDLMLSEISATGGVMILAIGLSLLGIKKLPAGNFLPALVFAVLFALLDPWIPMALKG